eukprot:s1749_g5.t4
MRGILGQPRHFMRAYKELTYTFKTRDIGGGASNSLWFYSSADRADLQAGFIYSYRFLAISESKEFNKLWVYKDALMAAADDSEGASRDLAVEPMDDPASLGIISVDTEPFGVEWGPFAGTLDVLDPVGRIGIAMSDVFRLQQAWATDKPPLEYTFYYGEVPEEMREAFMAELRNFDQDILTDQRVSALVPGNAMVPLSDWSQSPTLALPLKEGMYVFEVASAPFLPLFSSGCCRLPWAMQQLHSYDRNRTLCTVEDKATAGRLGGHSWNIISNTEQDEIYLRHARPLTREMPGPWVQSELNPGWIASQRYGRGNLLEFAVYDSSFQPQGKVLAEVKKVAELGAEGRSLEVEFLCVEDPHLHWWCREGPGKSKDGKRVVHLCHGTAKECKANPRKKESVFHTDVVRPVGVIDIERRSASWWIVGPAKKDFEAARSRILKAAKGDPSDDDKEMYPPEIDLDEFGFAVEPEGEEPEGAEAKDAGLSAKLAKLKKDAAPTGGTGTKRKGDQRTVSKEQRAKKVAKAPGDSKEKAEAAVDPKKGDEGKTKKKKAKAGADEFGWFGKPLPDRDSEEDESSSEPESSSSESAKDKARKKAKKKKKSKKPKGDRGPFGTGRKVTYSSKKEKKSQSDSEKSEASFQAGAPEKRSQQLILMEYADRKPGRLAARLLQKMQVLTNRSGAPMTSDLAATSSKTPPVAVQYYHTVMYPQNREKMQVRLQREVLTLSQALDFAAVGAIEKCADLISQRLKALELNMCDQSWTRAQYLELIPLEGAHLADTEEQRMATKEQVAEARVRQWLPSRGGGRGMPYEAERNPAKGKGKSKKGKGKSREPDPPAEKTPIA